MRQPDADLTVPVASCPGWNVGQLFRHLGGGQRWAAATVATRAAEPSCDEHFRDLSEYTKEDPVVLGPWLAEGAAELAETLREAGPKKAAEWVVDLTSDAISWRHAHEKAAVAVRGPLTDLLLVICKRRPARGAGVEILGGEQRLDFWLDRVSFG